MPAKSSRASSGTPRKQKEPYYKCTACDKRIKSTFEAAIHPLIDCLICRPCFTTYGTGDFAAQFDDGIDDQGDDNFCRWCCDGGELYGCMHEVDGERCHYSFCKDCIIRNVPDDPVLTSSAEDQEFKWSCYACDKTALEPLIKHAKAAMADLAGKAFTKSADNPTKATKATAENSANKGPRETTEISTDKPEKVSGANSTSKAPKASTETPTSKASKTSIDTSISNASKAPVETSTVKASKTPIEIPTSKTPKTPGDYSTSKATKTSGDSSNSKATKTPGDSSIGKISKTPIEVSIDKAATVPVDTSAKVPHKPVDISTKAPSKPADTSAKTPSKPVESPSKVPSKPADCPEPVPKKLKTHGIVISSPHQSNLKSLKTSSSDLYKSSSLAKQRVTSIIDDSRTRMRPQNDQDLKQRIQFFKKSKAMCMEEISEKFDLITELVEKNTKRQTLVLEIDSLRKPIKDIENMLNEMKRIAPNA